MGREIVNNLKFKKNYGKFNPQEFADLLDKAYLDTKRKDHITKKTTFSPSSFGYGHGNCARYWFLAFSGEMFIDDNDSIAIANMAQGTQAHERLQNLIAKIQLNSSDINDDSTLGLDIESPKSILVDVEKEILNDNPPIRGFIDLIINWHGEKVIGEIKTAKQEVWDTRQAEMAPSENHLLQVLTYMKLTEAKEGFLLYENKNTQQVLVIPVNMNERNQNIIDGLFSWLKEVRDNFENGELPKRIYKKTSSACKYCPIKKACWKKEDGLIQIDNYEFGA